MSTDSTLTARQPTAEDRIGALEAALRERTEEAVRLSSENVELYAAIFGHAYSSITHEQAVAEARQLRAERDSLHTRGENRRSALNDIAAVIWPNTPLVYMLADLVEAVQKMRTERDNIRAEHERLRRERDTSQTMLDRARARSEEAARDHDTERDRLIKISEDAQTLAREWEAIAKIWEREAASLRARLAEATKQTTLACAVVEALTHERDSLRARVESLQGEAPLAAPYNGGPAPEHYVAKAARTAWIRALIASLPAPPSPKTGQWKCTHCGQHLQAICAPDTYELSDTSGRWVWGATFAHEHWYHFCGHGRAGYPTARVGDAPEVKP